jgi:hypothetical protein
MVPSAFVDSHQPSSRSDGDGPHPAPSTAIVHNKTVRMFLWRSRERDIRFGARAH